MKKLISPSEWLLLATGKLLDFIEEIRDPFNLLENYYTDFLGYQTNSYTKHNIYQTIWKNIKTENIEKVVEKGEIYLKLTRQGKEKINRKFPLISFQNKSWDEKWRLVIYDIEEEKKKARDDLRFKLKQLGFGQLQKSVWITPYDFLQDFREFIESRQLSKRVILIETNKLFLENLKETVNKVWQLDYINKRYKKIFDLLNQDRKKENRKKFQKKLSDRIKNSEFNKTLILATLLLDPYLPQELLPEDWMGNKVRKLIKKHKIFG